MTKFEPHPTAPDGRVSRLTNYAAFDFPPGSAILCRNNAPLVEFAYGLLQRDVRCIILGKDLGTALVTIVKKLRATNLIDLSDRLKEWEKREVEKAYKEDRSPEPITDKASCIRYFIQALDEDSQSPDDLIAKIELMFTNETNGHARDRVTLSTIHKSKGLEYHTVFLLNWDLLPSRWSKKPWQQQQERNLQYVAVTRAKETLIFIQSECWKD